MLGAQTNAQQAQQAGIVVDQQDAPACLFLDHRITLDGHHFHVPGSIVRCSLWRRAWPEPRRAAGATAGSRRGRSVAVACSDRYVASLRFVRLSEAWLLRRRESTAVPHPSARRAPTLALRGATHCP